MSGRDEEKPIEALFGADRPILDATEDKLGYAEPARHVAKSILEFASPDGFVLGLEGQWGSGKSSFVNLISEKLAKASNPPEIVHFSPWLIRSREGMLIELFVELADASSKIELKEPAHAEPLSKVERIKSKFGIGANRRTRSSQNLTKRIQSFSGHLNRLSSLAKVAAWAGTPGAAIAADGMGAAHKAADAWGNEKTLEKEKSALKAELARLKRKIVIFVDDLDRLSPTEAGEVVRLVRAVADFPNVVYVLCYSRRILGQSLKEAYRLEDGGESYIDKIVQVSFAVPRPEDFDLRRMLRSEIAALFPNELSGNDFESMDVQRRFSFVIDIEGYLTLRSPRDVIRAVNAMILYAGPVLKHIDLADMMWLQLIRIRNQKLYDWIEGYTNSWAVISQGAHIKSGGEDTVRNELYSLLEEEGRERDNTIYQLAEMLPGFERDYNQTVENEKRWKLFCGIGDDKLQKLVSGKRIGSPEHFRFYFALSKPKGAVGDGEYTTFLELARTSPRSAKDKLLELAKVKRNQGGVLSESLIDRIAIGINVVDQEQLPGLLETLANAMDELAYETGPGDWGRYWVWVAAENIFEGGIRKVGGERRKNVLTSVFKDGSSIGWLSTLLRNELFSHGVTGDRSIPEEQRALAPEELFMVSSIMTERYAAMHINDLAAAPGADHVLFAWLQSGDAGAAAVKNWVAVETASDEGLLLFLDSIRSWRASGEKISHPLYLSSICHFMDANVATSRLNRIVSDQQPNAERASDLLAAIKDGQDF